MNRAWDALATFLLQTAPYWGAFLLALAVSLLMTPVARALAFRLGMVDQPSQRRINRTPIPRAGGWAVFLSVALVLVVFTCLDAAGKFGGLLENGIALPFLALSFLLCLTGFVDDKCALPPLVKLFMQVVVALGAHYLCAVGFTNVFPGIPPFWDALLTTFWIVGAINAFNLIDGLDGLASGLAIVAAIGMAGVLFFLWQIENALCYFAFAGACLGFLRYNFNPASVFLGDTGSMFLGFFLSVSALKLGQVQSFFVSFGVPLLAMGVPIFDTALAIFRRLLRALIFKRGIEEGAGVNRRVMQPDTDHLHHRLWRRYASQRHAVFALYGMASLLMGVGLAGVIFKGRAPSLFIVAFVVVIFILFRDMRRIELWDMGRLLNHFAHDNTLQARRRRYLLMVPFFLVSDLMALFAAWFFATVFLALPVTEDALRRWMALRTIPVFLCLVLFRTYVTAWTRAMLTNYARLFISVVLGTLLADALILWADFPHAYLAKMSFLFAVFAFLGLVFVRLLRPLARELFYVIDYSRMSEKKETQRLVVYGAGLGYEAFRRRLVRAASVNNRVIVALIDDDVLLRGQYIGGVKVAGTLEQLPHIVKTFNVQTVVVTCALTPARREVARQIFGSCNVNVVECVYDERPFSS